MMAALFAAGTAMQIAGGISNAISGYYQGKAQAKLYEAQARTLEINGVILKSQYDFQQEQLTDNYRSKFTEITGEAVQSAAHGGLKMSGSVAESLSQSLEALNNEEALQKYTIKSNYLSEKYGNEQNILSARYNAKTAKAQGRSAMLNGLLGTAGTALTSMARYENKWGFGTKGGTFGSGEVPLSKTGMIG